MRKTHDEIIVTLIVYASIALIILKFFGIVKISWFWAIFPLAFSCFSILFVVAVGMFYLMYKTREFKRKKQNSEKS